MAARKQDHSGHCDVSKTLLLPGPNWYHKTGYADLSHEHWNALPESEKALYVNVTDASNLGEEASAYAVASAKYQQEVWYSNTDQVQVTGDRVRVIPPQAATPPVPLNLSQVPKVPEVFSTLDAPRGVVTASTGATYQQPPLGKVSPDLQADEEAKGDAEIEKKAESALTRAWQALPEEVQKKYTKAEETAIAAKESTVKMVKDPRFQTVALGGGSGAVVVGTVGGGTGCVTGAVGGAALGVVPALFTFGLSIPTGAVLGGAAGTCTGATVGGVTGLVCGMAGGNSMYIHRAEIKDGALYVQGKVSDALVCVKVRITSTADATKTKALQLAAPIQPKLVTAKETVLKYAETAKEKAGTLKAKAGEAVSDKKYQSVAAGAAVGGVALGTGGGVAGAVAGAAVGIVPALFTFGLSIPVGFVMGGGAGIFLGGSAGAAAGGVAGYEVYAHGSEIKAGKEKAWSKASLYADMVKESATSVTAKIIGGGTGSTA